MELKFTRPLDAVEYALHLGLKVFPICAPGSERDGGLIDKTPQIKDWTGYAATTKPSSIISYAKSNPTTNFAVHCGLSNIIIIDVDVKDDKKGLDTLDALQKHHCFCFYDTFTVKTPSGGLHFYYFNSQNIQITGGNNKLGPGIDVQAGNKYALLFGSSLYEGKTTGGRDQVGGNYIIQKDAPMQEIPDWMISKLKIITPEYTDLFTDEIKLDTLSNVKKAIRWLRTAPICVENAGEHNGEYLYQIFCQVRDYGISRDTADVLVENYYNEGCKPPWDLTSAGSDKTHWYAKLKNAYNYAQYDKPGAKSPETVLRSHQIAFGIDPDNIQPLPEPKIKLLSKPILEDDLTGDPPEREWLVHEWLPLRELSSLYGAGGAGKSLLALQMAKAVSSGSPFMGIEVSKPVPVLLVACEDNQDELHRRLTAIRNAPEYAFDEGDKEPLYLWPRVGLPNIIAQDSPQSGDVVAGQFKSEIKTFLRTMPPGDKLLILDTLSDIYLGDENNRTKVNTFVKTHIGGLALEFNLTVLMLAHPSRAGANIGDMLSGSTAWNAAVRNRLIFTASENNEEAMTLTRYKSNYARAGESLDMEWQQGRFVHLETVDMANRAMTAEKRDILQALTLLYVPGDIIAIQDVATALSGTTALAHLFAGKHKTTITRKIMSTLQYPREINGVSYAYSEAVRPGLRSTKWLYVTKAEESELIREEKRLTMIDNLSFFKEE
jgi:RecA-family ATPase